MQCRWLCLIFILWVGGLSHVLSCGTEEQVGFNDPGYVKVNLERRSRKKRDASISDRKACNVESEAPPPTRVNTSARLSALRGKMTELQLDAFLIPSGDSHQSEYVARADARRQWIGGFSGSSGFAVVTQTKAAMWTDGRYFLQAEDQLDCNWLFMKGEEDDDASWFEWLSGQLDSNAKIGADPTLTGALTWEEWQEFFRQSNKNLSLVGTIPNPIDEVWIDQPSRSKETLEIHDVKYAGLPWEQKIFNLREALGKMKVDAMVVTALDEVAWLFNMRGNDIPYTPVFRAYAVVDEKKAILYLPPEKQALHVKKHLRSQECVDGDDQCVQLRPYESIYDDLESLSNSWNKVLMGKKVAYSGGASYAIYGFIPQSKQVLELSPIMLMKAQKNEVEISGMKSANIRDAVALMEMADILERGMAKNEDWDELKVAKKLKKLRGQQALNKGLSFPSISAYGANGAVIHYKPNNKTNTKIGRDAFFLLDSGGQYLDGTTDVTRTFHYGDPSDFEREVYTRVLMGSIDLARATFLDGTPDTRLDILARWNLYQVGLNYRHGTGHGIGAYGFIHESPTQVRVYSPEEHPMREGYTFSDEPGYYEAGMGGVRLETVLLVVKKPGLRYSKKDYGSFLGFEPICLVPFEPKLMDLSLMSDAQIDWLNNYNRMIREKVGPVLKEQNKKSALEWMMSRTDIVTRPNYRQVRSYNSAHHHCHLSSSLGILLLFVYLLTYGTS